MARNLTRTRRANQLCEHTHTRARAHTHTDRHRTNTHTHTRTHTHTHTDTDKDTDTNTHTRTHARTHTHTHTHTHTGHPGHMVETEEPGTMRPLLPLVRQQVHAEAACERTELIRLNPKPSSIVAVLVEPLYDPVLVAHVGGFGDTLQRLQILEHHLFWGDRLDGFAHRSERHAAGINSLLNASLVLGPVVVQRRLAGARKACRELATRGYTSVGSCHKVEGGDLVAMRHILVQHRELRAILPHQELLLLRHLLGSELVREGRAEVEGLLPIDLQALVHLEIPLLVMTMYVTRICN